MQLSHWPVVDKFLRVSGLVIGLREGYDAVHVKRSLDAFKVQPRKVYVVKTASRHISSSAIRQAIRAGQTAAGLLSSVKRYAKRQWLYVSVSSE